MRKIKVIFIVLFLCVAFSISNKTYAVLTSQNDLIRIHTSSLDYTITNTTTINQIITKFGQPKIVTDSAFGGKAYTFYTDSNYSNYLYIETLSDGGIISYGSVSPGFEVYDSGYGEYLKIQKNWQLCGMEISEGTIVKAGVYYNWNKWINRNSTDTINLFKRTYESNPTHYLKCISEHAVTMYNALCAVNGYSSNMVFDEDMFYINEQMKQNGLSLREYAIAMDKKQYVEFIGTQSGFDLGHKNGYYLFNPATFANFYYTEALNKHDYTSNYAIFDYDINTQWVTAIGASDKLLTYYDKIPLTSEENAKLERARSLYMTSMQVLGNDSTSIYTTTPIHDVAASLRAGELKSQYKSAILSYYNAIRAGQGLSEVTQHTGAFTVAQHMAVLNSYIVNVRGENITHSPNRQALLNDGVKEDFLNKATNYGGSVTTSLGENIAWSNNLEPSGYAMRKYVNQFIDDSSEAGLNYSHRVSMLHPTNSYAGYGIAYEVGTFEFGHDQNNLTGNEVVTWPSTGVTLLETLDSYKFNWSAQFYNGYIVRDTTEVTVKCLTTGDSWNFNTVSSDMDHYYSRYYQSGPQEYQNRVIFGDKTLIPQPGYVYQITVSGLKNASGSTVSYTYRSVFDYGDVSKYGTTASNIQITANDLIAYPNASKKYYVPIGEESNLDVTLDNGVKDIKVTWTTTDSSITLTQDGRVIVPDNYQANKQFSVTVKSDTSGATDTVTLVAYQKKGKITFNPSSLDVEIDKNAKHKVQIKSINGSLSGTVEWKIASALSPNTYYDITDEELSKYVTVTLEGDKTAYVTPNGVEYGNDKYFLIAIATTANGIFEGELPITIQNPVDSIRISSKLSSEGSPYYVSTQSDTYSELKCSANVSLKDLKNVTGSNKIGFKTQISPSNATVSLDTNWEIIEGENVISLLNNNGDVLVNNYGVAILRATNIESNIYQDLTLYVQEPLTNFSIAGTTSNFAYYADAPTDKLTINKTPANNYSPITYKSSNPNVASVDSNGVVSFKGVAGKVTITATCDDYTTGNGTRNSNKKTSSFEYTVTIPVSSIAYAKDAVDLNAGEYTQQTPIVTPSNISGIYSHITYTSSNTTVATVSSSGSVYGNAPGSAVITATVDPAYANGRTIKASYTVNVTNPIVNFSINGKTNMRDIESPYEFSVTPTARKTDYPSSDTYTVRWESESPEVASVDEDTGVVTPLTAGKSRIYAYVTPSYINSKGERIERSTLSKYSYVYVTAVTATIKCNKTTLNVGESATCTTSITPQISELTQHITYSSSNEDIAVVNSNGKVTAKAPGNVIIKMQVDPNYTPGKELKGELEFKITSHVKTATLEIPTLNTGDGSKKLSVTLSPQNTTDTVNITWSSSNPQVATIDPNTGVITPLKAGNTLVQATVIASYYDANGTLKNSLSTVVSQNVVVKYTEAPKYLKGDLDRNKVIDANDASIALEIFKAENATSVDIQIGDMDNNGLIDANDASLILELYKTNN